MPNPDELNQANRSRPKIFVVDDDPVLCTMLQSRLTANGYDVVVLTESTTALEKLKIEEPDLVITDILMPNVSGWEITQVLKTNPTYKDVPVILLSSLIEKEGKAERHELGNFFLSKPVMMEKLLLKVKEMLSESKSPNQKK